MKKILFLIGFYIFLLGILSGSILLFSLLFLKKEFIVLPLNNSPLLITIAYFPLTIWFLFTGIGIILRKNLARYSLIIMSYFMFFIGLVMFLTFFLLPEPNIFLYKGPKIILLTFFVVFFMILPLFFLFFLSSKKVKSLFFVKQVKTDIEKPLGIKLIFIFNLFTFLFFIFYVFFPSIEIPITNTISIYGFTLSIYSLVVAFLNLYIGIVILKLKKIGWLISIIYYAFVVMMLTLSILTISNNTLYEVADRISDSNPIIYVLSYRISSIFINIFSIMILIYLSSRKRLFRY